MLPDGSPDEGFPGNWVVGSPNSIIDVLVILAGDNQLEEIVQDTSDEVFKVAGLRPSHSDFGSRLSGETEHFGFRDGISQVGLRGEVQINGQRIPLTTRYGVPSKNGINRVDANSPQRAEAHASKREFQRGQIDHASLDVVLTSIDGQQLGRPWLTLLIDEHSRRILSFHLSFDPPCLKTCKVAIRHCFNKHRRLPRRIIIDKQSKFDSDWFQFLARHFARVENRRRFDSQFGRFVERLLATIQTALLRNGGNNFPTPKQKAITKRPGRFGP